MCTNRHLKLKIRSKLKKYNYFSYFLEIQKYYFRRLETSTYTNNYYTSYTQRYFQNI